MTAENEFNDIQVPAMAAELNRYHTGLISKVILRYRHSGLDPESIATPQMDSSSWLQVSLIQCWNDVKSFRLSSE